MKFEDRFTYCKFSGIYKITNKLNNKAYIGQAKNIAKRISWHINSAKTITKKDYNSPLHKAFRKYGIDNFELEILERADYDKLNEREIYWISKYNTKALGYNQTAGGSQSIRLIKLTEFDVANLIIDLKNTALTYAELAAKYNIASGTVCKINSGAMWHDNSLKYPIRSYEVSKVLKIYSGYCIEQVDLKTGIILNKFVSSNVAGQAISKSGINIGRCVSGGRQSVYGYTWRKAPISFTEFLEII